jgi:hypothetical protein
MPIRTVFWKVKYYNYFKYFQSKPEIRGRIIPEEGK